MLTVKNHFQVVYGIDVSLPQHDIIKLSNVNDVTMESAPYTQIPNNTLDILNWIQLILKENPAENILCVLEPTSTYSSKILHYLTQHGIAVHLVNPSQSSHFAKALGVISKNDKQAAWCLAMMGKTLDLPLYQKPQDDMQRRKQLLAGIQALKKQKQALSNQLHALDYQIIYAPKVVEALKETLQTVSSQLSLLEEELTELSDEEHQSQFNLMTSVVGIGERTAHLILSATGGLQHFEQNRQLSKFVGVVPYSHTSGSSIRKYGRITKKGNSNLRACLYMAARSAKRFNLACKELYERLRAAGKPYKKAMVAVMNKLLKQVFAVVKSGIAFDNQHYLKYSQN